MCRLLSACHHPLSLTLRQAQGRVRFADRRPVPLRVCISSGLARRRRVVAPAGESLSFVAPNESNQSKGALHLSQLRGCKLRPVNAMLKTSRTPAAISSPLASLRLGALTGNVCAANDRIALGPLQSRRAAQGFAGARISAPQQLTSGSCLSAAAAGREVSSARPAKTEQRRAVGPRPTGDEGRLSFGSFSLAKQRKGTRLSGRKPDAALRGEQLRFANSGTGLRSANAYPALRYRRVRLSGWGCEGHPEQGAMTWTA